MKYYITLGTVNYPELYSLLIPFKTSKQAFNFANKLTSKMNSNVRFLITNTSNK